MLKGGGAVVLKEDAQGGLSTQFEDALSLGGDRATEASYKDNGTCFAKHL